MCVYSPLYKTGIGQALVLIIILKYEHIKIITVALFSAFQIIHLHTSNHLSMYDKTIFQYEICCKHAYICIKKPM